jgi:hypothetical protein
MASVSGSKLAFVSPNHQPVNLILTNGTAVAGSTVRGAFNIEIFYAGSGSVLPGVNATATISGAVKLSSSEVQAGTLGSVEQLGIGAFQVTDETGNEKITLGTGAQTVAGSKGDTIIGGNAGRGQQVINLTGTDGTTAGPMTATGGAGALFVEAGSNDSIGGGAGPMTVVGGTSDAITGAAGRLLVEDVTNSTVSAGTGGTTVFGGNNDVIHDSVTGSLLVDIQSRNEITRNSPSTAGSGAETVDLGARHGATTLNDISAPGGSGPLASTTVTGFSTALDVIASETSVSRHGQFLGTSSVSGGNTILTFVDGTTMMLTGITNISKVTFTQ